LPYWELVTRSFRIAWDHKYLWLIALFSGEGGGASYNYSQSTSNTTRTTSPADLQTQVQHATSWLGSHVGLIVAIGVVWLLVIIAFFILAAVCEGATVRGAAEHDAGRPFGLRDAWRMGVYTMWKIARFRLLLLLLNLPLFLLIGGWVVGLIAAIANSSAQAVVPLVLTGLLLLPVWLVYGTYLFFLDRYGTRAVVLEERMAVPALARANHLLSTRFGRSLLVWLLSIGVAIVVGIALACVFALALLPLFAIGAVIAVASGASGPPWPLIVLGTVIVIPISLLIGAYFSAQGSTYWTLAFRRLDLDYAPAVAYPTAPQPPPGQPA
jgi:hypothetical protein